MTRPLANNRQPVGHFCFRGADLLGNVRSIETLAPKREYAPGARTRWLGLELMKSIKKRVRHFPHLRMIAHAILNLTAIFFAKALSNRIDFSLDEP